MYVHYLFAVHACPYTHKGVINKISNIFPGGNKHPEAGECCIALLSLDQRIDRGQLPGVVKVVVYFPPYCSLCSVEDLPEWCHGITPEGGWE